MDTKIIAVLAVAVVAVAAVAAVIAINADDGFVGVIYDGNGGETLEGEKTSRLTNEIAQTNMFEYKDHVFVAWNTSADGTGDIIHPGDKVDYGKKSIRLYAQWGDALAIGWNTFGQYNFKFKMIDYDGNLQDLSKYSGPVAIPKSGVVGIMVSEYGDIKWEIKNPVEKEGKIISGEFVGTVTETTSQGQVIKEYTVTINTTDASYTELKKLPSGSPSFYFEFDTHAQITISVICHEKYVIYNGNGGKTDDGKDVITSVDTKIADNMFKREGYKFAGWNTERDGTGVTYEVGQVVSFDDNRIGLFAQWNKISES